MKSPILFLGNATTAYRDPAAIYHDGVLHLFFTLVQTESDGNPYLTLATSKSSDFIHWTEPQILTPKDRSLNFSSPGNIIRHDREWILCLQTYPRPNGEKYGSNLSRVWTIRSRDLITWSEPKLLHVKGPDVPVADMGRMIDPYLLEDKDEPGKWWCFYKQNGVSLSSSYDLTHWTYVGHREAGENVCVLVRDDEYLMFHSPENGIGVKRSHELLHWTDDETLFLGQHDWEWARGRLTAGFVLDLRANPEIGKYLMFFHGSGPEDEETMFDNYASIGIAWSSDLQHWHWPGQDVH